MEAASTAAADLRLHRIQQAVKWTVYTLLLVNWGFYIADDIGWARHTLHAESTIFDWTSAFSTSIDELAWFILLGMFELETYTLSDRAWKPWVERLVHGLRLACYVMLAHTIFAYTSNVFDLRPTQPVEDATELCDLAGADLSYTYNLEYTEITRETCDGLSTAAEFYRVGKNPVVTDMAGLALERQLAWADLFEGVAWLLAILAIEVVVRLQERGITGGALMRAANWGKNLLYASILGVGVWWASLSHWLYLWDEILWIGGFMAIGMNLSDWRKEIDHERAGAMAA
ncbi:MAG: hypothetical protein OXQ29_09675 [Rhodospirillaceae bacterium]|nr:hypothetical protein [Rhodospirillaceae bacterium]